MPNSSSRCLAPVPPVCVVFQAVPVPPVVTVPRERPVPKVAAVNPDCPVTKVLLVLLVLRAQLVNAEKRDHLVCLSVVSLV